MLAGLAKQVRSWIGNGIDASGIGIAARTDAHFDRIERTLRSADIAVDRLGRDLKPSEGISLGTMHRMKGLEYRCIAIIDASADVLPLAAALTSVADDPMQRDAGLRRERSLLYVAATRARDDLWIGWSGKPSPFLDAAEAT